MFKKILVALNKSLEASAVLDSALYMSQPGSELLLLHFIDRQMEEVSPAIELNRLHDVDILDYRYDWSRQRLHQEVEICDLWLKTLAKKVRQHDIPCDYDCCVGNCKLGISNRAQEWGADLIIVGRKNYKNISQIFLGSVSNYVIHHAPCSVFVVQGSKSLELETETLVEEIEV